MRDLQLPCVALQGDYSANFINQLKKVTDAFPSMLTFLTAGTILGLSAGFAPGPLLALVISETLQHDMKAGVKVALTPILTDLPIIIITLFILTKLSRFHQILGIISIIGACFIFYLGIKNIKIKGTDITAGYPTSQIAAKRHSR